MGLIRRGGVFFGSVRFCPARPVGWEVSGFVSALIGVDGQKRTFADIAGDRKGAQRCCEKAKRLEGTAVAPFPGNWLLH